MPTQKYHQNAQLIPLPFTHPAFQGLNTETGGGVVDQAWASKLENVVFDEMGRPGTRKGWQNVTGTEGTGVFMRIFEYFTSDGTSEIIASTDSDIYDGLEATATSIKGTLTITDGNIKFGNFNDKTIAFGIGTAGIPAVRTTGNFADITVNSGIAPTGSIGTCAFGRVWGMDSNGTTLRYSSLLDETRWTTDGNGDGGSFDFNKVWPSGQDRVVAIEEFQGDLIVFGEKSTIILTDGSGASLGIDPLSLYVADTLPGVGAVTQFAVCRAAGDLLVLTRSGIVGLQRELMGRSSAFTNITKNIQTNIVAATSSMSDKNDISMDYNAELSMVVLHFPDGGTSYCFDTRQALQDGTFRCSSWVSDLQTITYIRAKQNWYGSLKAAGGKLFKYSGNDDNGTNFFFDYESGWLDLGSEQNLYLKFVKRMTSFTFVSKNVAVTHKVKYDFSEDSFSMDKIAQGSDSAEYNLSTQDGGPVAGSTLREYNEWNNPGTGSTVAEYGGGVSLRTLDAPLGGGGQYIKIGLRCNTEAGSFVLQQINLFAKIGRLAT
jgi:hypothetical protein